MGDFRPAYLKISSLKPISQKDPFFLALQPLPQSKRHHHPIGTM
jgi:hypothetical protein